MECTILVAHGVHTSEYSKEGVKLINKYWMKYTLNNIYQMEYIQVIESDGVFTNQFVILMYTSGYLSDGLYISKYIKWCVHQY